MPVSDLYARKSNSDAGKSVDRQRRAWLRDCEMQGFTPGKVLIDPNLSASRYATKERPNWALVLEHVKSGQCEVISLWEADRGSRQMTEWSTFLDVCRANYVNIRIFGEEPRTYDSRSQQDRESLMSYGMAAERESERIRSRTKAGTADAASQGRPAGPLKDGYKRVYGGFSEDGNPDSNKRRRDITQVIDEPRAQLYRWAAQGLLNGVPAEFIARVLNAWQIPTATGKGQWAGNAIRKALLSPTMEGHRVLAGNVVFENAWDPILDSVTAARLRAMYATPERVRPFRNTRLKYLLSGALLCGLCRRPMQGHARLQEALASRRERYECDPRRKGCGSTSAPIAEVDETVTTMVLRRLREPDALQLFQPAEDHAGLLEAERQLDRLLARQAELYAEAAKPGGMSMRMLAESERQLLPMIDEATSRLRALRTPPALRDYDPSHLASDWLSYDIGERRMVVLGLAEVVLSPIGKAGMWSPVRLGESRWIGSGTTWGEQWRSAGAPLA